MRIRHALTALTAGAGLALLPTSPAQSAQPTSASPTSPAHRPASAALDAYWTPQRMRAARPVDQGRPSLPHGGPSLHGDSRPFGGLPIVGTFFWTDSTGAGRFCSGSVVKSPGRNLVSSAAHCFDGKHARQRLVFVPKYDDGKKPYGVFAVTPGRIYLDPRYLAQGRDAAADLDFSFLRLEKRAGKNIQDVVGGAELVVNPGYTHPAVRVIGYPANRTRPLDCTSNTDRYNSTDPRIPGSFLRIHCDDYSGGVSGGPFLLKKDTGWRLIGVVGGWKTGGDKADISYGSYFDKDVKALYDTATQAANPPRGAAG
ncbi:hypothetical protein ACZ90_57765 [Streptomyces albus subsp. albus]|nr:hypothetical protein ACZ90_57765 [Streptomyces albus subsp. albus]